MWASALEGSSPFIRTTLAPVAQLDRASDYESEGHRFESCRVHHTPVKNIEAACDDGLPRRFFESRMQGAPEG
jgi:hypothetical protein